MYRMLGIEEVAFYIPEKRISNYDKKDKFDISDEFIKEKIGVEEIAVKSFDENTADLCVKAFAALKEKVELKDDEIDVVIVVTQNPDYSIPQTSAIVHGRLGLRNNCASFDISLGCSGFVYGLSVIQSFMSCNGFKKGLLFTSDPYSKIVNTDDKNTSLIFGDAGAVTLISDNPVFVTEKFSFGTSGKDYKDLLCENGMLYMNGRGIANFAIKEVPGDILSLLEKCKLKVTDVDKYLIHQGSRFIVNSIAKKLWLSDNQVVFDIYSYGNTVSSAIPILLAKTIKDKSANRILASGFGVGLSWSSVVLNRKK